jgi:hypothetical protein
MAEVARIEDRIDKGVVGRTSISRRVGGMAFENMSEVMEFAKIMAISDIAVPKHLRGNPGACLAVSIQAIEWRMSPYAVASKSYVVNDRIAYESQLIHAVIEQRAPITDRLSHEYIGQGENRQCRVWGYVTGSDGEQRELTFTSAPIFQITPKNSPLWKSKPDLQLYYNASRDWARVFFPDVIMGVYSEDEIDVIPAATRTSIAMPRPIEIPMASDTTNDPPQPEKDDEPSRADQDEDRKEFAECIFKMTKADSQIECNKLLDRCKELAIDDGMAEESVTVHAQQIARIKGSRGEKANRKDPPATLLPETGEPPADVLAAMEAEGIS